MGTCVQRSHTLETLQPVLLSPPRFVSSRAATILWGRLVTCCRLGVPSGPGLLCGAAYPGCSRLSAGFFARAPVGFCRKRRSRHAARDLDLLVEASPEKGARLTTVPAHIICTFRPRPILRSHNPPKYSLRIFNTRQTLH